MNYRANCWGNRPPMYCASEAQVKASAHRLRDEKILSIAGGGQSYESCIRPVGAYIAQLFWRIKLFQLKKSIEIFLLFCMGINFRSDFQTVDSKKYL